MKLTVNDISNCAKAQGVSDIRFAEPGGEITSVKGELKGKETGLGSFLEDPACLIVLFQRYLPALEPGAGNISVSPYYIASNSVYHAAVKITQYILDNGGKAVHLKDVSAKEAAMRTGGYMGDNGFYFHEDFGSYVCIQTILTDAAEPVQYPASKKSCLHCEKCRKDCPSSGVRNLDYCLRKYINELIPEDLRGNIYQLFGCEKCQSACPLNSPERSVPIEFSIKKLLAGENLDELKSLVGINVARKNRVLSHTAVYAANTGRHELTAQIKELSLNAEEPLKSHALWAVNKLEQRTDD